MQLARTGILVSSLLLLAVLLGQQWLHREQLPVHPIQQEVTRYLADKGEGNAMLLLPYWDVEWLGKTRHPVFADYQTAHLMTYMPALAPTLKAMHQEVFGFILDGETGPPLAPWPDRSPEQWQALAKKYGFRYLLAPAEMQLRLSPVLEGHPYSLYALTPSPGG